MRIERLDERVANRIAAGEVITEPLSVIKELLENSLDAGAKRIEIDILGAGLDKISIIDDGEGILFEDAPLVFERHATSKLRTVSDLYHLETMGFRGEALASVAAIAKVTLQSRSPSQQQGFEMLVYGSNTLSLRRMGRDRGTRIDVENLFYNTPVLANYQKRKYLLEEKITDFVGSFAIGNPHISIAYTVDHRRLFSTRGDGDALLAILAVYGEEVLSHLLPFSMETESFRVEGFQSGLGYSLTHRKRQVFLVNGRLVENPELKETLAKAYEGLLPARRQPVAILWLDTQSQAIDVNLHPRKEHVRLYREGEILSPLREELRNNLYQERAVAVLTEEPARRSFFEETNDLPQSPDFSSFNYAQVHQREVQMLEQVAEPLLPYWTLLEELLYIGAFSDTYLLFEAKRDLYIMDQHAAHEKVLYESFLFAYKKQELHAQGLLVPISIGLNSQEKAAWERSGEELSRFGFETELFGEDRLILRSIPHLFSQMQAKQYLMDYLAGSSPEAQVPKEEIIMRACKSAIKAGDAIAQWEVSELIESLKETDDPMTCPHGRPIFIKLSQQELEKRFARK